MSRHVNTVVADEVAFVAHNVSRSNERPAMRSPNRSRGDRQLREMIAIGVLILIVPATIGWLTRWRWQPWPSGTEGYGSPLKEARSAAATYVPIGFGGL